MTPDRQTVLVVDDTPENLDLMRAILSPHYKVKVAINGEAALKLADASPPDIVLLDVMMPGMDGYEVCRRLKAEPARHDLPVVLVSARSEMADDGRGFALGAADYIGKPVSAPVVLARVRTQLALHRRRREVRRLSDAVEAAVAMIEGGSAAATIVETLKSALPPGEEASA